MSNQRNLNAWDYLSLSLMAFGGFLLEAVLAFLIEPIVFKFLANQWSTEQQLIHWNLTCAIRETTCFLLIGRAKNEYGFYIFAPGKQMKLWQWLSISACVLLMIFASYLDWNGFKIVQEYRAYGWLRFAFQYMYYVFETALFTLIIIFGQKGFEQKFMTHNTPYGGILSGFTWGIAHAFTKGSISAGLMGAVAGFIFTL